MPIVITMIGNLILALAAITAAVTDDFVGDANNRGVQFFYGEGVEQSYETAVEWWVKAAEGNNVHALFNLGTMYDQGKGVAQNYTQAMQLYERAAEQGHANSQFNLGNLYHFGRGVEASDETAAVLYEKAAQQDHERAKEALEWIRGTRRLLSDELPRPTPR